MTSTTSGVQTSADKRCARVLMQGLVTPTGLFWNPESGVATSSSKRCISANGLDGGTGCTLSKLTDDTKLVEVVDTTDGCAAIQWDLNTMKTLRYLYWGSPVQERPGDTARNDEDVEPFLISKTNTVLCLKGARRIH
ncbi:hypothetical protein llap_7542 [Limosa lapponica baueri]|uniref:Uncharacterized protein n=1 Tax=Limosa lapponica baueri TaxID=1758121 RepID=A0A2I0U7V4_LIMLA|nr:hypothetical protein llap_7542 [Limosa lapponica baueri]